MAIRQAHPEDIPGMMRIIRQAQRYMKENGIDQWQNGYPSREVFLADMERGESFLLEEEGGIRAIFALSFTPEEDYREIRGAWNVPGAYGGFHRVAVDEDFKGRGYIARLLRYAEEACRARGVGALRVDTHADNRSMQRALAKNGFSRCGEVTLAGVGERIAFDKPIGG